MAQAAYKFEPKKKVVAVVETITKETALDYLRRNKKNRPMSNFRVNKYAAAMARGEWLTNGEGIIFSDKDDLLDGQHRLQAVIVFGSPVEMLVVRGVDESSFATIDGGDKRTIGDILHISGEKYGSMLASTSCYVYAYQDGKLTTLPHHYSRLSATQSMETVAKNPSMRESAAYAHATNKDFRSMTTPTTIAFCHWLLGTIDAAARDEFFESFRSGADLQEGSPILVLRTQFTNLKINPRPGVMAAYVVLAWNKWRRGESCGVVRLPKSDTSFPVPI